MGDNRANVYFENDKWIYRASSLGNCVRQLVALRLGVSGVEAPDDMQKKFDEGNVAEPLIIDELNQMGYGVRGSQNEINIAVDRTTLIRGHIDGMSESSLVEVKAFGKNYLAQMYDKGITSFPYYQMQVSIYKLATGASDVLFVVGEKDDEGVLVRDKEGHVVLHYFMITDGDLFSLDEIIGKVKAVEAIAETGKIPEVCDVANYPCPVWFLHDRKEVEIVEVDDAEFAEMIVSFNDYSNAIKDYEKRKEELKIKIMGYFDEIDKRGGLIKTKLWEVRDVVKTWRNLDIAKLKANVEDLDSYYKDKEIRYPQVKARE